MTQKKTEKSSESLKAKISAMLEFPLFEHQPHLVQSSCIFALKGQFPRFYFQVLNDNLLTKMTTCDMELQPTQFNPRFIIKKASANPCTPKPTGLWRMLERRASSTG